MSWRTLLEIGNQSVPALSNARRRTAGGDDIEADPNEGIDTKRESLMASGYKLTVSGPPSSDELTVKKARMLHTLLGTRSRISIIATDMYSHESYVVATPTPRSITEYA